jgi:hypothetical protein
MGFLSPRTHGYLDWAIAFLLVCAPGVLHFGGVAATLSCLAAAGHLAMSVCTDYPLGVRAKIAFSTHGTVELATALFLIAAPWAFGFDGERTAKAFFLFAGYSLEALWLFTSYQSITGIKARDYRLARATSVSPTNA